VTPACVLPLWSPYLWSRWICLRPCLRLCPRLCLRLRLLFCPRSRLHFCLRSLSPALTVVLARPCPRPVRMSPSLSTLFPGPLRILPLVIHFALAFDLPAACQLALPLMSLPTLLLAPGSVPGSARSLASWPPLLTWALLVFCLRRWPPLFALFPVVLSRGWFPLALLTRFLLLVYVCWPRAVALRHALRPWVVESWGVRRIAPGYSRCCPATSNPCWRSRRRCPVCSIEPPG
jgi:hypothetical protein